ncbi:hypothetical protein RIF29_27748 [Crotalaria pallida]|uniref:Uncharacterized protein n=1 Tax=Crotalaria pallida TaxID=3830 RepID=A0AAN9EPM8_CROPI
MGGLRAHIFAGVSGLALHERHTLSPSQPPTHFNKTHRFASTLAFSASPIYLLLLTNSISQPRFLFPHSVFCFFNFKFNY